MSNLTCPCCGGYVNAEEWKEARQWLELMGIEVAVDGTVDTKGAALMLGKAVQTLENLRSLRGGPIYSKDAQGRVRYHLEDITAFREGFVIKGLESKGRRVGIKRIEYDGD